MSFFAGTEYEEKRLESLERSAITTFTPRKNLQTFVLVEDGANPIEIRLSGNALPKIGAEFDGELRGETYIPIGGTMGIFSATGIVLDKTTFSFAWEVPYFSPDDVKVKGASIEVQVPEDLDFVFREVRQRARSLTVQIGAYALAGVVKNVKSKPTRGYLVNPATGAETSPGTNLEVEITFEWQGYAAPVMPPPEAISLDELRETLSRSNSYTASVLNDADPFEPNLLQSLNNLKNNINKTTDSFNKAVKQLSSVSDIVTAPARIVRDVMSAARAARGAWRDFGEKLGSVPDEYLATANNVARGLLSRQNKLIISHAQNDALTALNSLIDIISKKRGRLVGTHPGEKLSDIAKRELGNGDRWREIADKNNIKGNIVPKNTYTLEISGLCQTLPELCLLFRSILSRFCCQMGLMLGLQKTSIVWPGHAP